MNCETKMRYALLDITIFISLFLGITSPTSPAMSAHDRFSSPIHPSSARRNLFSGGSGNSAMTPVEKKTLFNSRGPPSVPLAQPTITRQGDDHTICNILPQVATWKYVLRQVSRLVVIWVTSCCIMQHNSMNYLSLSMFLCFFIYRNLICCRPINTWSTCVCLKHSQWQSHEIPFA